MFSWRKLFGLPESIRFSSFAAQADDELDRPAEFERYVIERQLVLLRPKAPYVRWVHQGLSRHEKDLRKLPGYDPAGDPGLPTLADLRKDCTAYLIAIDPEYLDPQAMVEHVEHDFVFFFKRELEQWEREEAGRWPQPLTLALFRQWFEVESFDMVLDTANV